MTLSLYSQMNNLDQEKHIMYGTSITEVRFFLRRLAPCHSH